MLSGTRGEIETTRSAHRGNAARTNGSSIRAEAVASGVLDDDVER
jgi:hypothetical protein